MVVFATACSDPQCPPDEGKVQDVCFPLGGMDAEVEEDAEAEAEADVEADAEPARDARIDSSRVDAQPAEASDACGGSCTGGTPVCTPGGQCVACSATERGACTESQQCDVLAGACVECLQQTDCKDPKASVCDSTTHKCKACGVSSVSDCDHVAGKNVCAAGECVECSKDNRAACVVQVNATTTRQNSCSALTKSCTSTELGKTAACGECESDAECTAGHACVSMEFVGQVIAGKHYCQPLRAGANCDVGRPYISDRNGKLTIDGATQNICTLANSTCAAHGDYRNKFCGLDANDQPIAVSDAGAPAQPSVKGDNGLCGALGLDDGYCVETAPGAHRCTVGCDNDARDCPVGQSVCLTTTHASGTLPLCRTP